MLGHPQLQARAPLAIDPFPEELFVYRSRWLVEYLGYSGIIMDYLSIWVFSENLVIIYYSIYPEKIGHSMGEKDECPTKKGPLESLGH